MPEKKEKTFLNLRVKSKIVNYAFSKRNNERIIIKPRSQFLLKISKLFVFLID